MASGTLLVLLRSATALKDTALFGKQHPYATLSCGEYTVRSRTHQNGGSNPVWHEQFFFKLARETQVLVEIYSDNALGKDAHIGTASVPLARVRACGRDDAQVPVAVKGGKQQGMLALMLEFRVPAPAAQPPRSGTISQLQLLRNLDAGTSAQGSLGLQAQAPSFPLSVAVTGPLQGHTVVNPSQGSRRPSACGSTASSSHDVYMLGADTTPPSPYGSTSTNQLSHAHSLGTTTTPFTSQQQLSSLAEPSFLAVVPRQHSAPTAVTGPFGSPSVQQLDGSNSSGLGAVPRRSALQHSHSLQLPQQRPQQQQESAVKQFLASLSARNLSNAAAAPQRRHQQQQAVAGLRASLGIGGDALASSPGGPGLQAGSSISLQSQQSVPQREGQATHEADGFVSTGYDLSRLRALIEQIYPPDAHQEQAGASAPLQASASIQLQPSLPFMPSLLSAASLPLLPALPPSDLTPTLQQVQLPPLPSLGSSREAPALPSMLPSLPLPYTPQLQQLLQTSHSSELGSAPSWPVSTVSADAVAVAANLVQLQPGELPHRLQQELLQVQHVAPTVARLLSVVSTTGQPAPTTVVAAHAATGTTAQPTAAAASRASSSGTSDVLITVADGFAGTEVAGTSNDAAAAPSEQQHRGAADGAEPDAGTAAASADSAAASMPAAADQQPAASSNERGMPAKSVGGPVAALLAYVSSAGALGSTAQQQQEAGASAFQQGAAGLTVDTLQQRVAALSTQLASLQLHSSKMAPSSTTGGHISSELAPNAVPSSTVKNSAEAAAGDANAAAATRQGHTDPGQGAGTSGIYTQPAAAGVSEPLSTTGQHGPAQTPNNTGRTEGTCSSTVAGILCAALQQGQVLVPQGHAEVLQQQLSERAALESKLASLSAELSAERQLRAQAERHLETLQVECVPVQEYEQLEVVRQQRDGLRAKLESIERTSAIVPKTLVSDYQKQMELRAAAEREASALRADLVSRPDTQLARLAQLERERSELSAQVTELERKLAVAEARDDEAARVAEQLAAERRLSVSLQARLASAGRERELLLLRIKGGEEATAAAKQSASDAEAARAATATELMLARSQAGYDRAALQHSLQALQVLETRQQQLALGAALLQYELLSSQVQLLQLQGHDSTGQPCMQVQQQQQLQQD